MKVIVEQSGELTEVEVIIRYNDKFESVKRLTRYIEQFDFQLQGKEDGKTHYIPLNEIYYFESIDEKIFIYSIQKAVSYTHLDVYKRPHQPHNEENEKFNQIMKEIKLKNP
nr:hypothetical protein A5881_000993 [Enterococcus termitis]